MQINFGSGTQRLDGFLNVDTTHEADLKWDLREPLPYHDEYDFVLVNHLLCVMNIGDARKVLANALQVLKVGGHIELIDVDIIKAFSAYHNNLPDLLPIPEGTIDYKLTMHLSGYGTRLSLYTKQYAKELLAEVGFINPMSYKTSQYDTRPNESLVIRATKGRP